MKFQFKMQPFQTEAAMSVVRVFAGQPKQGASKYTRDLGRREGPSTIEELEEDFDKGYLNESVKLSKQDLLKNIRDVQTRNDIMLSPALIDGLGAAMLDVEMETGTGKTYVYIKTMFELYSAYG